MPSSADPPLATATSPEASMALLASSLDQLESLDGVLEAVTRAAVALVPGCELAGVTLLRPGRRLASFGTTSPDADAGDRLQYELEEGPCVDAAREDALVESDDVTADPRWPRWGPRVAGMIASVLSVQMVSARGVHGALNLYSRSTAAFGPEAVTAASVLSIHAGVALRTALLEDDIASAVTSRKLIGQAQGILMERYRLDEDAAFAVLRRQSQTYNIKVVEIARDVVERRRLRDDEG